jgi:hypothetical protein
MSAFLSAAMVLNIIFTVVPFVAEAISSSFFEYDGYTVDYAITNSWNNGQENDVKVTITNTGQNVIENWMLAYDFMGTVNYFSRAQAFETDGVTYVKNVGTNLEGDGDSININPGKSVDFSYHLTNPTGTPDSFSLCQERVALVYGIDYEVSLNPQYDYGNTFQGQILITNLTDKAIECWELTFVSSNFALQNSWERTLIDLGDGRYVLKPIAENIIRIAPNSTLTVGFQANKDANIGFADLEITFDKLTEVVFGERPFVIPEITNGLVAYGYFDDEENYIVLEWSCEDTNGIFNIYETSGNKTLISSITDETTYIFEVDNSVEEYIFIVEKYISDNEVIVSNEVVMRADEDGYFEFVYVDSDDDDLADIYEHTLGTDPQNPDTDGDGLPDGYEVYTLGTDPLLHDTDDNGITDADEDFDNDGLTNLEEYLAETDPFEPDTDNDGLTDYEEVNIYDTDPLEPDTDGDGLKDGTEVELGLDPLNPDTDGNGIVDGDEIITQEIDLQIADETSVIPSVVLTGKANLHDKLYAKDISSNPVVGNLYYLVGEPFDFVHDDDFEFENAILSFKISDELLLENNIEDLAIIYNDFGNGITFLYSEIINGNTISAIVEHFSVYTVVNKKIISSMIGYDELGYINSNTLKWRTFGGHTYAIVGDEKSNGWYSWEEAKAIAEKYGGHLVTITSAAEQYAVENLVYTAGKKATYWLGARNPSGSKIEWITGETSSYTNWGIDEPNNSAETYMHMVNTTNTVYEFIGQWNDTRDNYFIGSNVWYSTSSCGLVIEWDYIYNAVDKEIKNWQKYLNNPSAKPSVPNANGKYRVMLSDLSIIYLDADPLLGDRSVHSDKDGLCDLDELLVYTQKTIWIGNSSITNYWTFWSYPDREDSDGDGLLDGNTINEWGWNIKDPKVLVRNKFIPFGSDSYMAELSNNNANATVECMMNQVNSAEYYNLIPTENWTEFCLYFNEKVITVDKISDKLHYFRNKLNRTPNSFQELVDDKTEWFLYNAKDTRYHMNYEKFENSITGEFFGTANNHYNLKFTSLSYNGIYEVVVTPKDDISGMTEEKIIEYLKNPNNWLILTDDKNAAGNFKYDPLNMGTYNYHANCAEKKEDEKLHNTLDVDPYKTYGNVKEFKGINKKQRDLNGNKQTGTSNDVRKFWKGVFGK